MISLFPVSKSDLKPIHCNVTILYGIGSMFWKYLFLTLFIFFWFFQCYSCVEHFVAVMNDEGPIIY
jgi:hypothetical protein